MIAPYPAPGATVVLIYAGWMPDTNALLRQTGYLLKQRLRKRGLATFGQLPPPTMAHWPARVTLVRVLGPGQRLLDESKNLSLATGPLVDALVLGGWLVDDSPKWARFMHDQDATRRQDGPRIEVTIRYVEVAYEPNSEAAP
jgi:hypothetical protein